MTTHTESTLRIGLLVPEVLGTYGDSGNAEVLAKRAEWRGIPTETLTIGLRDPFPTELDIYLIGGGEDTAQSLAAQYLRRDRAMHDAVERDAIVLAICGGMQVLGEWYTDARGTKVAGAGIVDLTTTPQQARSIGELVTAPLIDGVTEPLTGFENHGGATHLGPDAQPLGRVMHGIGNASDGDPVDGCVYRNVIGTYMHGPLLARNPQLADELLRRATGRDIAPLDHAEIETLRAERIAYAKNPKLKFGE